MNEQEAYAAKRQKYPVFNRVNGRLIPGFQAKEYLTAALIVALAVIEICALGAIKTTSTVPMSEAKRARAEATYIQARNLLFTEGLGAGGEGEGLAAGPGAYSSFVPDGPERDRLLVVASEKGITARTTDAEIGRMLPATEDVVEDAVPLFARWMAAAMALGLFVGVSIETPDGASIKGFFARWVRWRRSQKVYLYRSRWFEAARAADAGGGR
jgi:hypothetical protein